MDVDNIYIITNIFGHLLFPYGQRPSVPRRRQCEALGLSKNLLSQRSVD